MHLVRTLGIFGCQQRLAPAGPGRAVLPVGQVRRAQPICLVFQLGMKGWDGHIFGPLDREASPVRIDMPAPDAARVIFEAP